MTRQLTIPPAHVWDRIEKILDEQENRRKHTEKIFSETFFRPAHTRSKNYFVAMVSGAGLLALIMLKYSPGFKND